MAEHTDLDLSKGWCCNGKTWTEHAHESGDGECCQPAGTQLSDLPDEGRRAAEKRLAEAKE